MKTDCHVISFVAVNQETIVKQKKNKFCCIVHRPCNYTCWLVTRCFFQNAATIYLLCISNDFFGIGLTGFSLVPSVSPMKISRVPQDGRWRTVLICMPLFPLYTQLFVASRGRDLNLTASLLFFLHDRITLTAASACNRSHFTLSGRYPCLAKTILYGSIVYDNSQRQQLVFFTSFLSIVWPLSFKRFKRSMPEHDCCILFWLLNSIFCKERLKISRYLHSGRNFIVFTVWYKAWLTDVIKISAALYRQLDTESNLWEPLYSYFQILAIPFFTMFSISLRVRFQFF